MGVISGKLYNKLIKNCDYNVSKTNDTRLIHQFAKEHEKDINMLLNLENNNCIIATQVLIKIREFKRFSFFILF